MLVLLLEGATPCPCVLILVLPVGWVPEMSKAKITISWVLYEALRKDVNSLEWAKVRGWLA